LGAMILAAVGLNKLRARQPLKGSI